MKVLIVDDDPFMRGSLVDSVENAGHEATACAGAAVALDALGAQDFEVAVSDLKMPGMSGIEFLEQARLIDPALPVILITAHGTVETAVTAMKQGAFDYILKPFGEQELLVLLDRALAHRRLLGENEALRGELRRRDDARPLVGHSPALKAVLDHIHAVAASGSTVLVRGETGTGKELVARAIHYASPRAERPYLCVNCAALSAGLLESELFGHVKGAFTGADRDRTGRFELADGGTLLLDEVSEIEPTLQAKLLRVLQERAFERVGSSRTKKVDVRVIATTNRDLQSEVRSGRFRQDLFYRLNVFPIEVPPLRERKEDILELAEHFQRRYAQSTGRPLRALAASSSRALLAYHWPGNIRELENLIERAVLLSPPGELVVGGLGESAAIAPAHADLQSLRGLSLEELERLVVTDALDAHNGSQKQTAAALGIGVRTLRDKMKKWGLTPGPRAVEEVQTA